MADESSNWRAAIITGVFGLLTAAVSGFFSYQAGHDKALGEPTIIAKASKHADFTNYFIGLRDKSGLTVPECKRRVRASLDSAALAVVFTNERTIATFDDGITGYVSCFPDQNIVLLGTIGPSPDAARAAGEDIMQRVSAALEPYQPQPAQ